MGTAAESAANAMSNAKDDPTHIEEPIDPEKPWVITQPANHVSGIPLGGIGTGSVEIRPDGTFADWLIFNMGGWSPGQGPNQGGSDPGMDTDALAIYLWARKKGGDPIVRRMNVRPDQQDLYSLSWARPVQAITYDGRFPVVHLTYADDELPVQVSAQMFSPIIPHDSRTSGTPGAYMVYRFKNVSNERVDLSLATRIKNPLARGADQSLWTPAVRKIANTIAQSENTTYLTLRTGADIPQKDTLGSLGLSVTGGKASWIKHEFGGYLANSGFWGRGPFGSRYFSWLDAFRAEGELPNLGDVPCPTTVLNQTDQQLGTMSQDQLSALVSTLRQTASMKAVIDEAALVDPSYLNTKDGLVTLLGQVRDRLAELAGSDFSAHGWGDAALCSSITLAPGEEKEIALTLGWYFPHHISSRGPEMGHMYQHWFSDAEDVNKFLVTNRQEHQAKTKAFSDLMFETTLPPDMAFSWTAQLTTLIKSSWWTGEDKFAIWEGLGCCGLHTMDITYQGSFPLIALFPDLQKKQILMGAQFQRADGRVAHFFAPDLSTVDNGFDRVDMNQQFVMVACRDYLWTADKDYLTALYPHVVKAMNAVAALDGNGDGLPDQETGRNTYDQWDLRGTPSYISSLWLGALLAAIRMASDMNDTPQANTWSALLEKSVASFEKLLWNGEYYSLWVDGPTRDDCCMSDQLSGEWYAHIMGVGHALPADRIRAALVAIAKHNFNPEQGLVNASYPEGRRPQFPAFNNPQAAGNWSGIEYAVASMLIDFGIEAPGRGIISAVHNRYMRAGRCWNHVECGDHYYRAMSSWASLLASTGFKVDMPHSTLTVAPQCNVHAPWVSSTAMGALTFNGNSLTLGCHAGSIAFQRLRTNVASNAIRASLDGKAISHRATHVDRVNELDFGRTITLGPGQALTISG
jgi:uncharacterized protein (DUF608 family)